MTVLQTARMTLRPCCPTDRDDFIGLERDPQVMLYLNGGQPLDRPEGGVDGPFLMPRGLEDHVWTARRSSTGAFVGWFCLWPDTDRSAEIGYRLRAADWGQGLASEGARALVRWGFDAGRYDRICASTMVVNHASRRVLEKAGLTHERTVRADFPDPIPGSEEGEALYGVRRADWTP